MRHVTIRTRGDGVIELAPKLAPLEASERMLVVVTVLLVAGGLFVSGVLPAPVLFALAFPCLTAELLVALRALALVVLRPAAEVHEVAHLRARRR